MGTTSSTVNDCSCFYHIKESNLKNRRPSYNFGPSTFITVSLRPNTFNCVNFVFQNQGPSTINCVDFVPQLSKFSQILLSTFQIKLILSFNFHN